MRLARPWRSCLNKNWVALLLPPPSQSNSSEFADGYAACPPLKDAVAGKCAGVAADAEVDVTAIAFEIVQAVRDHIAVCERREIVIEDADRFVGEQMAVAIEFAQKLTLFRVDTEDRIEGIEVKLFVETDDFELLIAIRRRSHRRGFERLTTAKTKVLKQLFDHAAVGRGAEFGQAVDDGADGQVGPQRAGLHGVAGRVNFEDLLEVGFQLLVGVDAPFASTPFFRHRSGGTSGRLARSTTP